MSDDVETALIPERKKRFQGHEPFNAILREDWIKAIKLSPDHFEASLYRPVGEVQGDNNNYYQEETVTELDTHQDQLTYDDSELVAVLDCPDEQEHFFMMDANDGNLGESVEPLLLRIGAINIPLGSVLEWDEEIATGTRTVWWYVHKAMGYGAANVGVLYACIPMRDFNKPEPEPELESESELDPISEETEGVIEL